MRAAAAAAAAGTALQGLFAVYKPPGIHWRAVRDTVETHLIKGLNSLERPEPRQQICFQPTVSEKETGKELTLTVSQVPMLADHPLALRICASGTGPSCSSSSLISASKGSCVSTQSLHQSLPQSAELASPTSSSSDSASGSAGGSQQFVEIEIQAKLDQQRNQPEGEMYTFSGRVFLISGPVFTELKIGVGDRLDMQSSGVFVLGVGYGTKLLRKWYNAHLTRAYTVTGLFGKATDDFSDTGKLIERSTFDHVTREKLERIVSVIQGSNHKALLQPPPSRGFLPRRRYSPPKESEEPESEEPLCFTKSPANPRRWTTRQSMGSDHQQPLWRAMLISLTMTAILLWCYLRPETEADRRAEEFLQFLQILPQQELPPPVPSGEDEKKP